MKYQEQIVSHQQLKEDVLCYWQMSATLGVHKEVSSRYLPKGQSLLIFNFGGEIHLQDQGLEQPFFVVPAFATGMIFSQQGSIDLFGISLVGDGLYQLIQQPLPAIGENLFGDINASCQQLYEQMKGIPFEERTIHAESFLLQNLNGDNRNELFEEAIKRIQRDQGKTKIADLCQELKVSQRHLQRLFKERMGISPKTYVKIIRVNQYLEFLIEKGGAINWMEMVVAFDYHDQPHLINEVKSIAKLSPQKLLNYRDTLYHRYLND